ncbi:MAG: hypothetical protein ACRD1U_05230 [Vicinamibacterales bacterium]
MPFSGVGLLVTAIALVAPLSYAPFSGFTSFLIGPAHWLNGSRAFRRRILEVRVAPPASSPETM